MSQLFRGFAAVAVVLGLGLSVLKRLGLLGAGECDPLCECSTAPSQCDCGHKTCLSPAAGTF